jgi:uncharacterized protein (DUF1697 family)
MTSYLALLRAVNLGPNNKLPMSELKRLCEDCGFDAVKTYIASGNVVFHAGQGEAQVKALLETALAAYAGKPVGVLVRTAGEMATVLAQNPFPAMPANKTVAIFLDASPPVGALEVVSGRKGEEFQLGKREIYVYYPDGIGESKLKIPAAKQGTARNMNTIAELAGHS